MGLLIPAGIFLLLFGDDDEPSAWDQPGQPVPGLGEIPVFPGVILEPPGPPAPLPTPPVGPLFPPPTPTPEPPTPTQTLVDVYDDLVRPVPTPGYLYAIQSGDAPATVLNAAYGSTSSFIWQCFTSSKWNWEEYATEGTPGTSWSKTVEGVLGQVTAAFFPMHEPVRAALELGRLPQRTILWNRGSNGQIQPRGETPLPLAGPKTWGTVFLPRIGDCGLPYDAPAKNPAGLFTKLGIAIPEWSAWA